MYRFTSQCCLIALLIVAAPNTVYAQGLIWSIPEDGAGVEYEGTISYITVRTDIAEGTETIKKARELSIKSVGRKTVQIDGVDEVCRWIEIKVVTGTAGAAGIDPGPVGSRIYKILVPESKIIDTPVDADSIPNIVLPIVEGWRRSGEAGVRIINSKAISFYPTICQLAHYPQPQVVAASETVQVVAPNQTIKGKHLKGRLVMERRESRSTNDADFWVSDQVPFGLARWEGTVTREQKESTATRDKFLEVTTTTCEMSLRAVLKNAESELSIPAQ